MEDKDHYVWVTLTLITIEHCKGNNWTNHYNFGQNVITALREKNIARVNFSVVPLVMSLMDTLGFERVEASNYVRRFFMEHHWFNYCKPMFEVKSYFSINISEGGKNTNFKKR